LTVTLHLRALDFAERTFAVTHAAPRRPNPAFVILNDAVISTIIFRHGRKLTCLQSGQPSTRSYPQASIARTKQGKSATGVSFVNPIIPRFEVGAIEAEKPIEGAYPKKTISRLRERNRGSIEYTILKPPGGVSILRQTAGRAK
jgi:hypothetical protein